LKEGRVYLECPICGEPLMALNEYDLVVQVNGCEHLHYYVCYSEDCDDCIAWECQHRAQGGRHAWSPWNPSEFYDKVL